MNKDELFSILNPIAKGIADTFGPDCETLIHDLDTGSHPILAIYNGHVSGRTVGSSTDIMGLPSNPSLDISRLRLPHINMLAESGGRKIKSTTIPIQAEDGMLGLGINFDYTSLAAAHQALRALTAVNGFLSEDIRQIPQLDSLFCDAAASFDKPLTQLTRKERLCLVSRLRLNHFFEQQRAIPYLAEKLGLSRYTIYKDLKELDQTG